MNSDEYKKAVGMDMINQRRRDEAKRESVKVATPAPEVKQEKPVQYKSNTGGGV